MSNSVAEGQRSSPVYTFTASRTLPIGLVVLMALTAFMGIGIPIDAQREGRFGPGIIVFAACAGLFFLLLVWLLVTQTNKPRLRIDAQGFHRVIAPYARAEWSDIEAIHPAAAGTFQIVTKSGWVTKSGSRTRTKSKTVTVRYFRNGAQIYPVTLDMWNAYRNAPPQTPSHAAS